ncbi:cysteine desulfurase, SufS family protein [Yersinia pseudotuberculosis PB1/+]|uniref:aminotransferase class V-fold PLP-dependent enzyme n=1 Tax=Yersinia pseudotuberculosis TaxID=633 RepID=UPI00017396C2|nr:SufS family cysteine desulfurase [Yersinia pseudotuberculosis]AJJ69061.1 cysteine desulfurase, SufS family protein [Yersinia pseudotuberculosis PB1/+]
MIRTKINSGGLDVDFIRDQFPILKKQINGHPLVYLDNASTCQKPQAVIDAITKCYCEYYANAHRGVHTLSQCATTAFEHVREQVRDFLHARSTDEVIFTRGTTEAINLVATSWGKSYLHEGDEVLISALEHHSNLVPWQQICRVTGARLKVLPIEPSGVLQIDSLEHLLSNRTRVLALSHVSNVLGTINPLAAIIQKVRIYDQMQQGKKEKTIVLIDGAQAVPHISINVQELDADFYAFSGHKLYGPSGIGVLYGGNDILRKMLPWQYGGGMVADVSFEQSTFVVPPRCFEAGTANIAGVIGLGAAITWLQNLGIGVIAEHEQILLKYVTDQLSQFSCIRILGQVPLKAAVVAFIIKDIPARNIGLALDKQGIAVQVGRHCAQPLMNFFGLQETVRVSFAVYNTLEEIDVFISALHEIINQH